jgi:DNA-directed RNA polymerase subunit RPC12/RpoP
MVAEEKQYKCARCGLAFKSEQEAKEHLLQEH